MLLCPQPSLVFVKELGQPVVDGQAELIFELFNFTP
jgi:hypothetical protein